MRIKSFFADTVEEALAEARRELGPEAMLIQSRPAPAEARSLGDYEVVCALLPSEVADIRSAPRENGRRQPQTRAADSELNALTREIDTLRGTVEQLQAVVAHNANVPPGFGVPAFEQIRAALVAVELDPELALEVVERAHSEQVTMSTDSLARSGSAEQLVQRQLAALIQTDPALDSERRAQTVIALVGPPGAGKTTCIAALAAHYGVARGRATEIIALDEHRVAACEQLRAYAAILGAGFRLVNDRNDLGRVVEDCRWKNLILVDTPGFSFAETDGLRELAATLRSCDSVEVHLVLPCAMRTSDLRHVADFYAPFSARRLIFTRLDETRSYGNIMNESVRLRTPVSFLTSGPRIPDDIEAADVGRIAELMLEARTPALRATAAAG